MSSAPKVLSLSNNDGSTLVISIVVHSSINYVPSFHVNDVLNVFFNEPYHEDGWFLTSLMRCSS